MKTLKGGLDKWGASYVIGLGAFSAWCELEGPIVAKFVVWIPGLVDTEVMDQSAIVVYDLASVHLYSESLGSFSGVVGAKSDLSGIPVRVQSGNRNYSKCFKLRTFNIGDW